MRGKMRGNWVAMLLLGGVAVFFMACEKEATGERGGKVAILFSVGYDDALRSFNGEKEEPKAVFVELDNDEGYFFSATLTADEEEEIRATSALIEGQKVHLEAYYNSSGLLAEAADYHADASGRLVLDDPDSPLEVDPALGPYDFSAYSYYKSTSAISITGIDPRTDDLIWGNIENQPITATEAGRTVSFDLKHMFARVRVKVSVSNISGAEISEIGDVAIESQNKVDLTVKDGALADGADVGALDVSSSLTTEDDITYLSDYYVFYPSPAKVTISDIKILESAVEYPLTDLTADFAQSALTPGKNYTLAVDVQKNRWAYSNIYWEGNFTSGYLTFDRKNLGNQEYRGVFFRRGSLVGVGSAASVLSDASRIYIPNISAKTWDGTRFANSGGLPWSSYYWSIPYLTTTASPYGNSFYSLGDSRYSNYLGDICSYLDGDWRMANSTEFAAFFSSRVYTDSGNRAGDDDETGKGLLGVGYLSSTAFGVTFLPNVGWRYLTNSIVLRLESHGYYWAGTGERVEIYTGAMAQTDQEGCAIRCIRKLPTD